MAFKNDIFPILLHLSPHQLHAEFIVNFYLSLYEIQVCGMTLSEAICYCVVKYKKAAC